MKDISQLVIIVFTILMGLSVALILAVIFSFYPLSFFPLQPASINNPPPSDSAAAVTYYVATTGSDTNSGTRENPFRTIQNGVNRAQPGDTVLVLPGTYNEQIIMVRTGKKTAPITLRAETPRTATITSNNITLQIGRGKGNNFATTEYITVEGFIIDGQYAPVDTIKLGVNANYTTLRNLEVRHCGRDCIDLASPDFVTIENSLIHHALWCNPSRIGTLDAKGRLITNCRLDAHGIAAGGMGRLSGLVIRNTEIHTFSGDAIQIDPNRHKAGWDVRIENSYFHCGPLKKDANLFTAGTVPCENAIDTKAHPGGPGGDLTVRNSRFSGFRGGLINNMSALNIKENVDFIGENLLMFNNQIANRIRLKDPEGNARYTGKNIIVYDSDIAFRLEDGGKPGSSRDDFHLFNSTIGKGVGKAVTQAGLSSKRVYDFKNTLVLGSALPAEMRGSPSNITVNASSFVDANQNNYRLAPGSPAIDTGITIAEVAKDFDGIRRPMGSGYDIGAYEFRQQKK